MCLGPRHVWCCADLTFDLLMILVSFLSTASLGNLDLFSVFPFLFFLFILFYGDAFGDKRGNGIRGPGFQEIKTGPDPSCGGVMMERREAHTQMSFF